MASGITFKSDPLKGRSNYIEWINRAKLFLEINGFMPYIDGTETPPNKSLYVNETTGKAYSPELAIKYNERVSEYQRNEKRALGAIKSIISFELVEIFKDKTTAKSLWDSINKIFGESSIEIMGRYLNRLIESNYTKSEGMDEYTNSIQSSYNYLKSMKYDIPKAFIVWFLFRGLPSYFDGFASRKYEELAKNQDNIDLDSLFSELISEEARMRSNIDLYANKTGFKNNNKTPYCSHCHKKGHLESTCFIKYPELKNNKSSNMKQSSSNNNDISNNDSNNESNTPISSKQLMTIRHNIGLINKSYKSKYKFILDSGATEHYSPNKEWFMNYKPLNNHSITVANGKKLRINGIGDIPILINNKSEVILQGVYHIPNIASTLISSNKIAQKGWASHIIPPGDKINIINKRANIRTTAHWIKDAYYLNFKVNFECINTPKEPKIREYKRIRGLIPKNKGFAKDEKRLAFSGYFNSINKGVNTEIDQDQKLQLDQNQKLQLAFDTRLNHNKKIIIKKPNHILIESKSNKKTTSSLDREYWLKAINYETNIHKLNNIDIHTPAIKSIIQKLLLLAHKTNIVLARTKLIELINQINLY
ncbi:hypothetical protein EAE96_000893 [Botrytis aclada]|nr:hypothetical protein EAE96_000893 [Botrytis aclada]